jgi:hypothetical protein
MEFGKTLWLVARANGLEGQVSLLKQLTRVRFAIFVCAMAGRGLTTVSVIAPGGHREAAELV